MGQKCVNYKYVPKGGTSIAGTTIMVSDSLTSENEIKAAIQKMRPHHIVKEIISVR